MANRRKLTAKERRRIQAMKARIAKRKAAQAEDELLEDEIEDDEIAEMVEEAKRKAHRRYRARKAAQARMARLKLAQEDEELDTEDDLDDEEMMDEVEARKRCRAAARKAMRKARRKRAQEELDDEEEILEDDDEEMIEEAKRAKRIRRAKRRAQLRRAKRLKRAQENVSDDLTGPDGDSSNIEELLDGEHVSDDLAEPDEGDGGKSQTPTPSVNEAEDKIVEAYRLIENQIAHNIVSADVRKASLARDYMKKYSKREMKFASMQLENIGSVSKSASKNVRVSKRGTALQKVKAASQTQSNVNDFFAFM